MTPQRTVAFTQQFARNGAPQKEKHGPMHSFNGMSYVNFNDGFSRRTGASRRRAAGKRLMLSAAHTNFKRRVWKEGVKGTRGRGQAEESE